MDVSENSDTPKSSILIGFCIIDHPFWGTPIFGNTHIHTGFIIKPYYASNRVPGLECHEVLGWFLQWLSLLDCVVLWFGETPNG